MLEHLQTLDGGCALSIPHAKWVVGSNAPAVRTVSFLAWKKAEKQLLVTTVDQTRLH